MNFLAHLALSAPTAEERLGNILADLVRPSAELCLPEGFVRGMELHRVIDSFTDRHELVQRSKRRVAQPLRRYSGIIVDMFYDHLLSLEWDRFHNDLPRQELIGEFYESLATHKSQLPAPAYEILCQMRDEDWLGSYAEIDGIRDALRRIAMRLSRHAPLEESVIGLSDQLPEFSADFCAFYPELMAACRSVYKS